MRKICLAGGPLLIAGLTLFLSSCKKDAEGYKPNCSTTKTFAADVAPVMQSSCSFSSGCHASGSTSGPGALTNHQQIFNARASIRTSVANGRMPQGGALTNAQKDAILCWIDGGAPNN